MDLFELWATLGLDTTGFINGLTDALSWALGQIVDFAKDVVETGMGFDEQMSAVQAVLGKEEGTVENMIELREFALDQARQSIFTSEEVAKAYYYMGMAGWKTDQMLAGLPGVLNLAAASGEDLARVSDIVTDSITAFGLTADDVSMYVDILAQTATNSNTDVRRMGETFKYVAPIAGALGYDVEDVALSIGLLASAGIKGSQAGTTLRNIFTRIATNAGATSKDLGALEIVTDKLGVSFYDAEGKARDWGEVLTEMRAAWRGLSGSEQREVIDAFNASTGSIEEADITLKEFAADVEEAQKIQSKLAKQKDGDVWDRYANQIGEIGKQYDDLFTKLNIPIPKRPEEYADALEQARIKLGLMSDQEQIYYSKQIGSMRGMSGFLRMMEAEDEEVEKLVKAYENAQDAAEAMAGVRLDNLSGDIKLFNAALDVMKVRLFDNVKGPLREFVQYGTDALNRITDAITKDGIIGGIDQLAIEIEDAGKLFAPMLESIGEAAAPLIDGLFTKVLPKLEEAGMMLASGLLKGLGEGLTKEDSPLGLILGTAGYSLEGLKESLSWLGIFSTGKTNNNEIPSYALPPELTEDKPMDLTLDYSMQPGWNTEIANELSGVDTTGFANAIGSAGTAGGTQAANNIQSQIDGRSYVIDVFANLVGGGGFMRTEKHARSMFGGNILRGATIFGMNALGQPMVAGGEGPEAVVGTTSLNQMIQSSVNSAMSGVVGRLGDLIDSMPSAEDMGVYLDGDVLVGGISRRMNGSLNSIAKWRGSGRA